ncbi:hypothetical protein BDF14DRAFT_1795192 [Spinellus fusiger]|nr:hypothetical protein BDF14DRAFT_1795192 [Spinellus fusiger]
MSGSTYYVGKSFPVYQRIYFISKMKISQINHSSTDVSLRKIVLINNALQIHQAQSSSLQNTQGIETFPLTRQSTCLQDQSSQKKWLEACLEGLEDDNEDDEDEDELYILGESYSSRAEDWNWGLSEHDTQKDFLDESLSVNNDQKWLNDFDQNTYIDTYCFDESLL